MAKRAYQNGNGKTKTKAKPKASTKVKAKAKATAKKGKVEPKQPVHRLSYPSEERIRSAMIERAKEFARVTGTGVSEVGRAALNDTAFVSQLEQGRNFQISTYTKFMAYLDEKSPRDTVPPPLKTIERKRARA